MFPDEVFALIFDQVDHQRTYFNICLACKHFWNIINGKDYISISRRSIKKKLWTNHLYMLLKYFPDHSWDWYHLSRNPNITWNIIKSHNKPWDYLSIHPM